MITNGPGGPSPDFPRSYRADTDALRRANDSPPAHLSMGGASRSHPMLGAPPSFSSFIIPEEGTSWSHTKQHNSPTS